MNSPKLLLLNLEDSNKGKIFIEIVREEGLIDGSCKKFYLYSKFFVVNETPYNLFFSFITEKRKYAIPGQYFDNSTS